MTYKMPLVSIVLATFNGEDFLKQQLQSIVEQTYKNIELVVQDDGSHDKTTQILKSYESFLDIRLEINEKRLGFVKNFERGLSRANGEYIALCDQDDIWHPEKISNLVGQLFDADLIHGNCRLIDSRGHLLARSWKAAGLDSLTALDLLFKNYVTGCTVLFKSELLNRALPFPEGLAYHDWWLALCAATGSGIKFLEIPLVDYRQHGNQDTGAGKDNWFTRILKRFTPRYKNSRKLQSAKQLANLNAAHDILVKNKLTLQLRASVAYHRALQSDRFSLGLIFIGLKYSKNIRPFDKFHFIKFYLNDIFSI